MNCICLHQTWIFIDWFGSYFKPQMLALSLVDAVDWRYAIHSTNGKLNFHLIIRTFFLSSIPTTLNPFRPFTFTFMHSVFILWKWQKSSVADFMINKIAGTNLPFFTFSRLYKWISFVRLYLAESSKASGNNQTQFHLFKKIVRI